MCEQNTLSKLYGNLPQTSSLWHRADRGTTRSARDPSGTTRLRTCPQDDIVFRAGGFAPCTPIREREHRCLTIIVQFGILFFHIQVCQQSEPFAKRRRADLITFRAAKHIVFIYRIRRIYRAEGISRAARRRCNTRKTVYNPLAQCNVKKIPSRLREGWVGMQFYRVKEQKHLPSASCNSCFSASASIFLRKTARAALP